MKSRANFESMEGEGGKFSKFKSNNNLGAETRSELQFPISNKKVKVEDFRSRYNAPQSFYQHKGYKSPELSPNKQRY